MKFCGAPCSLEIEREALKKENDAVSKERLTRIEKELAELKTQSAALQAQWKTEKEGVQRVRTLREQIEQVKVEIAQAERAYDLNKAAELKYGTLTDLERQSACRAGACFAASTAQRVC